MSATSLLGLPLIDAAQAQKHVTHNAALLQLDGLLHLAVASRNVTTPPVAPNEGDRYLVGAGGSGAFASQANAVALWQCGTWVFLAPKVGWRAYVVAENLLVVFDGTQWRDPQVNFQALQNLGMLGVGTSADATNRFAAKSNAMLLTARPSAEGGSGDLRVALNKASSANTASFVLQSGWSGRAEIGLTGDDRFRVKVSPDGTNWNAAIDVDPATARVNLPGGFASGCYATASQPGVVKPGPLLSVGADGALAPQLGAWTNVASAATLDLGAQASLNLVVTGGASITSFGATATTHGLPYTLRFAGTATLVNAANLILPGGANVTAAPGDIADVVWEGAGIWRVVSYQRASGAALAGTAGAAGLTGFRNRFINGDMRVAQRGAQTIAAGTTAYTACDRFYATAAGAAVTATQASVSVAGSTNALAVAGAAGNTQVSIGQRIEAANIADLAGQQVTVSGWLWSSAAVTPTLAVATANSRDTFGAVTYVPAGIPSLPTLAANAWTFFSATLTLPPGAANGLAIEVAFGATVAGVTRQVTSLQIEAGASATSFERRPIGLETSLCLRYFLNFVIPANYTFIDMYAPSASSNCLLQIPLQVPMRATPTFGLSLPGVTWGNIVSASAAVVGGVSIMQLTAPSAAQGRSFANTNASPGIVMASAEL